MINFLKFTWLYILISTVVVGVGLFSVIRYGFTYSIEFVGGSDVYYEIDKPIKTSEIQKIVEQNKGETIEISFAESTLHIRLKPIDEKQEAQIRKEIGTKYLTTPKLLRFETVGPVIGKETMQKTAVAALLAMIGILLYMSFAFKGLNFALAAILAMIHDFLVVVGTYSLFSHFLGAQIDTMFVTALLTTMSFSVHDTIVIFDKIREYFSTEGRGTNIEYYANKALTETLVRSLNNSMTIIFMLLALTLLGGSTIKFFVVTLLVGTVTGTYSSPFIATPILVWLEGTKKK